uniref:Uncharacterized protein n=1 Tax=Opuntia streptacantha TaxID=393608 RepID=A0A7C9CF95_OPUST
MDHGWAAAAKEGCRRCFSQAIPKQSNQSTFPLPALQGKRKRRRWLAEGEETVAAPGLRQPATVFRLLGETGDEEETQGSGTKERQVSISDLIGYSPFIPTPPSETFAQ